MVFQFVVLIPIHSRPMIMSDYMRDLASDEVEKWKFLNDMQHSLEKVKISLSDYEMLTSSPFIKSNCFFWKCFFLIDLNSL